MKTISVLMVTPWYGSDDRGGVAGAVENLVHGLQRAGVRTFVIKIVGDGLFPRYKKGSAGELIIRLPLRPRSQAQGLKRFLGYWTRLLLAWLTMGLLLLLSGCQIVNFHYYDEHYEDLRKTVRAFRRSVVITFHGSDIAIAADNLTMRDGMRRLVADSVRVATVSNNLLQELLRKIPESATKSTAIPNSVDLSFLEAARDAIRPVQKDIDILFVGGLRPVKGPDLLLEAFAQVLELMPDARLCMVGAGEMEDDLKRKIESERLGANVEMPGWLSSQDLIEYYRRAKVVAMPSRSEGFPLVAIEAAILGRPVVATNVGGLPELVAHQESGIVVSAEDASELAQGLLKLLQDSELLLKLGNQARDRAISLFHPAKMAASYRELYSDVINAGEIAR